jgi:hypothetical protein
MRYFLLCLSLCLALLTSCASSHFSPTQSFEQRVDSTLRAAGSPVAAPQAGLPAGGSYVVLNDPGKKNTYIIQTAPGNTATAKQIDNTGRGAGDGANGGHAVVENTGPGIGSIAGLCVLSFLLGGGVVLYLRK